MGAHNTDGTSVSGGGWLPACKVAGCSMQADQVQPARVVGKAAPSLLAGDL